MIICAQCGEHNEADDRFCGACDAFLEWEGEPATAEQSLIDPAEVGPGGAEPDAEQSATAAPRSTVAQPTETRPRPRARASRPSTDRPPAPGELICGQCGAGNVSTRRFCRRCGAPLADAEVVKTPWWRRVFRKRPKVKTAEASAVPAHRPSRPRRPGRAGAAGRRAMRWGRNLLALGAVAGISMYGLIGSFREAVNDRVLGEKDRVEDVFDNDLVPVRPVRVTATAALPKHGAALATDNATDTYWAAPIRPRPVLVLFFDHPVQISQAIVHNGVGEKFQNSHRAGTLHLVFATGQTDDVELEDTPDSQEVSVESGDGGRRLEIHLDELHRSVNGSFVAISEIELFESK
jgi:hypothetical protein